MAKSIMNQAFQLDAGAMAEFEAYAQTICRDTVYHLEAIERFQAKQPARFNWDRDA
jgi:2-(1,2-epoxy-1,2-dihydrophenyl)acetyl-CoA isomerase